MKNYQLSQRMLSHVKEWRESGETMVEYSQKLGMTHSKFEYWVRKANANAKLTSAFDFIDISSFAKPTILQSDEFQTPNSVNPQIELRFPNGLCLKIY